MMFSMSDVRGPFQSSHFGSGSSMGRLYRISDDRRCGRRWSRHWEKSLSFVCSSVMEVDREVRLSLTAATREERNSFANVVEPTGWPRRRKPVVSSNIVAIGGQDTHTLTQHHYHHHHDTNERTRDARASKILMLIQLWCTNQEWISWILFECTFLCHK